MTMGTRSKIPPPQYLVAKESPYVTGHQDYLVLSKDESEAYFQQRCEAKRTASSTSDLLALAVKELGTPESFQDLIGNPGQTVNPVQTVSLQPVPSTSRLEPALPAQLPIRQVLEAVQQYFQSLQQPTSGMVLSTSASTGLCLPVPMLCLPVPGLCLPVPGCACQY